MGDLRCKRSQFINPVPAMNNKEAGGAGFVAIAYAFVEVFEGEAWSSRT